LLNMRERERIYRAAAFVVVLASGATAVALLPVGPFYPAPSFPAFTASPLRDGVVTFTRPVIVVEFDDGEEHIDYRGLLPAGSPNPIGVFRSIAAEADSALDPATAAWLMQRLTELHPGREALSLRIDWTRYRFRAEDRGLISAETSESFVIPLDRP
jgi:hypothetical protein